MNSTTYTNWRAANLRMQGFAAPTHRDPISRKIALRIVPGSALVASLAVAATISIPLSLAAGVFYAIGAVTTRHPADLAFAAVVRLFGRTVNLGPTPAPRRFSSALAGACFAMIGALIALGAPLAVTRGFALMLAVPAVLIVTTNWCLGAWIFRTFVAR